MRNRQIKKHRRPKRNSWGTTSTKSGPVLSYQVDPESVGAGSPIPSRTASENGEEWLSAEKTPMEPVDP